MQTLWTRVALNKGCCHCPQCISSAHAISRRATTSTSRRVSKYFTTSTALYTSIFAAAATFDAGNKQERREQWDRAIEQAKLELGQDAQSEFRVEVREESYKTPLPLPRFKSLISDLDDLSISHVFPRARRKQASDHTLVATDHTDTTSPESKRSLPFKPFGVELDEIEARPSGSKRPPWTLNSKETGLGSNAHSSDIQEVHGLKTGVETIDSFWPTNTGIPLLDHNLPPQSIYVQSDARRAAREQPWTPKKLATSELCIDKLQLKVFALMQKLGWSDEGAAAVPEDYSKHILQSRNQFIIELDKAETAVQRIRMTDGQDIDRTRSEFCGRLCSYVEKERSALQHELATLNFGISELFSKHSAQLISTPVLLAQLMHKLHVSRTAPDVNIYNTLLGGLSKFETPHITRYVIGSLRGSNIRPNELTLAAILRHYINTNNPVRFIHWIELIRGKHRGLGLARPGIRITEAGKSRLVHRKDQPNKVIQVPYANPMVFKEMIAGALKFGGFDLALRICEGMGREGWGLCMQGMTPLLSDCADRADWDAGRAVWDNILALKEHSRRRGRDGWETESIGMPTFAAMLRLCIQCSQRGIYDQVWADAMRVYRSEQNLKTLTELVKATQGQIQAATGVAARPPVTNLLNSALQQEPKIERCAESSDETTYRLESTARPKPTTAHQLPRKSLGIANPVRSRISRASTSFAIRIPTIGSTPAMFV